MLLKLHRLCFLNQKEVTSGDVISSHLPTNLNEFCIFSGSGSLQLSLSSPLFYTGVTIP